jgi:fructokinase
VEDGFFEAYGERLPMADIVQGSRDGDPRCRTTFDQFIDDFGRCLGGLVSILDPDVIVLGGGLSKIGELYTAGIEKVRQYAFHPHVETPIVENALGDAAGVYGAAWLGD